MPDDKLLHQHSRPISHRGHVSVIWAVSCCCQQSSIPHPLLLHTNDSLITACWLSHSVYYLIFLFTHNYQNGRWPFLHLHHHMWLSLEYWYFLKPFSNQYSVMLLVAWMTKGCLCVWWNGCFITATLHSSGESSIQQRAAAQLSDTTVGGLVGIDQNVLKCLHKNKVLLGATVWLMVFRHGETSSQLFLVAQ